MTDKEKHKFYHSSAWAKKRMEILKRDHFECQECRRRITTATESGEQLRGYDRHMSRATCVHHIKELADHPELSLDADNLISLCDRCHNRIHGRTADKVFTRKNKKKPATREMW